MAISDIFEIGKSIIFLLLVGIFFLIIRQVTNLFNSDIKTNKNVGDNDPDTINAKTVTVKGFRDKKADYTIETTADRGKTVGIDPFRDASFSNGNLIGSIKNEEHKYKIYNGGIQSITTPPKILTFVDGEKISGIRETKPVQKPDKKDKDEETGIPRPPDKPSSKYDYTEKLEIIGNRNNIKPYEIGIQDGEAIRHDNINPDDFLSNSGIQGNIASGKDVYKINKDAKLFFDTIPKNVKIKRDGKIVFSTDNNNNQNNNNQNNGNNNGQIQNPYDGEPIDPSDPFNPFDY